MGKSAGRHVAVVVVVLCYLALAPVASAVANFTWSGAAPLGQPGWSKGANWIGSHAPAGRVGRLGFPALTPSTCNASPPTATCYQSTNDLTGLFADAISIDDGTPYYITGGALTLGPGGITAAPSASSCCAELNLPITLSAAQTWTITGGTTNQQLALGGNVAGVTHALGIKLTNQTFLGLGGNVEVGAVTVTAANPAAAVTVGSPGHPASLNGSDGQRVTLRHAALAAFDGSAGALVSTGSRVQVGEALNVPAGELAVDGSAKLDSASSLSLYINHSGTTAETDYSQLKATGAVNLASAHLFLTGGGGGPCPALHPGDVDTLLTTTASLTGTFAGLPNGSTTTLGCSSAQQPIKINYTAHTVTGTIEKALPGCQTLFVNTAKGHAVIVQLKCSDPTHAKLTYAITTQPAHGKLGTINQTTGQVTYTPAAGFTGQDSFDYHATSVNGTSNTAFVGINVTATKSLTSSQPGRPSATTPAGPPATSWLARVGGSSRRSAKPTQRYWRPAHQR